MRKAAVAAVAFLVGVTVLHGTSFAAPTWFRGYLIDAHSQIEEGMDQDAVVPIMDRGGVYRAIISAIGDLSPLDSVALAQKYPGRIVPAVTTKGPGYPDGDPAKYYGRLNLQVNSGRYQAMAEVLIYHALKQDGSPEKIARIGDAKVQAALGYAVKFGWPFVLHIEFAAIPQGTRGSFMRDFESVLAARPDHPFVLIHMGQLNVDEVQRLIQAHRNAYFLTSATTPGAQRSGQPWVNLFSGRVLAPEWRGVFVQHPDRFIFAADAVGRGMWQSQRYLGTVNLWRWALEDLPLDAARAVAHGNAERLWKLPPRVQ